MGPAPFAEGTGHLFCLLLRHLVPNQGEDRFVDLANRLAGHVPQNQRLVIPVGVGLLQRLQDGSGRVIVPLRAPQLGVHRAQHSVGIHHNLVRRQRNERPAGERVVRDKDRDLPLMTLQRTGNLLRRQDQAARGVQHHVYGHIRRRESDGPQNPLRVLNVNVPGDGEPQQAHRLLAVNHRDDPALALHLQGANRGLAPHNQQPLLEQRDKGLQQKQEPEQG